MNKKDLNLLNTVQELLGKVPAVSNGLGAKTATTGAYVKAYDDFQTACLYANIILYNRVQIEKWNEVLKNPEADRDNIKEMIDMHEEQLYKNLQEFKDFIQERIERNWN